MINAVRGLLAEYGWIAPKGRSYIALLGELMDDELGASFPEAAPTMFQIMLGAIEELDGRFHCWPLAGWPSRASRP